MAVHMQEIDIWYYAWSFGLNEERISWISQYDAGLPKEIVDRDVVQGMRSMARGRTRSQMKRLVLRRRRSFNHDLAIQLRHEREVRWERGGMRCYLCRGVPPQPGEIMEEE